MKTKKITQIALLVSIALIIHVVEAQIPPIVPVPGVKLGLSNIITVLALYLLKKREAVLVVLLRVILSSMFSGSFSSFLYSAAGSVLSLCVMLPLSSALPAKFMYLLSILGAAVHNLGQILVAMLVTQTPGLIMYLPVLILSGCIAGLFTGLCATAVFDRLNKARAKKRDQTL